jgi:Ca2+-binding RTX toxin-like protein
MLLAREQITTPAAAEQSFEFFNMSPIQVPRSCDGCPLIPQADPYPSSIEVSGFNAGAVIDTFAVSFQGFTHGNPDDIDILLVTPAGLGIVIMSDAGGGGNLANGGLSLTNSPSATALPNDSDIGNQLYGMRNYEADPDDFPAPAPALRGAISQLKGSPANGTWQLYIVDDTVGFDDGGTIANGWLIQFSVNEAPGIELPSQPSSYVENGPAVAIDAQANLFDPDTPAYTEGLLKASWTNLTSADALRIRNQGTGAGLINTVGNAVFFGDQEIGAFSGGVGAPLEVRFTLASDRATPVAVQALLRNLFFSVASEDPSGLDRTVTLRLETHLNEGGSATVSKVVHVTPVADAPTISALADQAITEDSATNPLAFTIGDLDTAVATLALSALSSNRALLPPANIVFGGSGASRTVKLTPVANGNGTADVTIRVSDGGRVTSETLRLVVSPVPDPTLLRVRKVGNGGGTITSAPGGVNCGPDCTQTYEVNATVTLKATPRLHSFFRGWTGGGCRGRGDCVVKLTAATTVRARFVRPTCLGQPATRVGVGAFDGTDRDDVLVGTAGPNRINGRGGDDRICSGAGNDVVDGGPGDDTVQAAGGKDLSEGGPGRDVLDGGAGEDRLIGGTGADELSGGPGDDALNGGPGAPDRCRGGPGRDQLATAHQCEVVAGVP